MRMLKLALTFTVSFVAIARLLFAASHDYWDQRIGNPGLTDPITYYVWATVVYQHEVIVGGQFTSAGGVAATNVARWDGVAWSSFGEGLRNQYGGAVTGLAVAGNQLYATGVFDRAGGVQATNIAGWNGQQWLPLGTGLNSLGWVLAAEGSQLYAGGSFSQAGGIYASLIARWDGTAWSALGTGVGGGGGYGGPVVRAIAISGARVVAGGIFTRAGEVQAANVAMWDGAKWSALGNGLTAPVLALAFHGSELYAGGQFRIPGTGEFLLAARWTGSDWILLKSIVGGSESYAHCFESVGRDLYVGAGGIRWPDGANFLKLAPDGLVSAVGGGIDPGGGVHSLSYHAGGLYVGGLFTKAGNVPSKNVALWQIPRMLTSRQVQDSLAISWPAADSNLVLEAAGAVPSSNWTPVLKTPALLNGRLTVTNAMNGGNQFFRLRQPDGE